MVALIVIAVVVVFALIMAARTIRVIPQARAGVVERLGRYQRVLEPGLALVTPFIDRVKPLVDLREQVVNFAPQSVITDDNVVVNIETVLYFTITDPRAATYEIASPLQAIEQLTRTTLRNVIGGLTLEATLTARENVNSELRSVLDEATGKWGIRINRVEIKSVDPPSDIRTAMEKQMRAERDRRAAILTAEGERQAAILTAEGQKQAAVLRAEGEKQSAVLQAEGEAKAIDTVFTAIHEGRATRDLLSYEYLKMLPRLAEGEANKVFVVPSEFTQAFGGIGEALTRMARRDDPNGSQAAQDDGSAPDGSTARGPAVGGPPAGRLEEGSAEERSGPARIARVFDALSEKLQATLGDLRQHGTLSEQDIDRAMREIRLALLEADVNFKVVKQFTSEVKERCLGADLLGKLNPGQQVVKIVSDELTELMGGAAGGLSFSPRPPTVILMAGLQGSGKTTAAAKLARYLREEHSSSVALAACDVYRPAAVEQLVTVGTQAGATVYERGTDDDPVEIAAWALERARQEGKDVLIVDTSGRLHIDEQLMAELVNIRKAVTPHDILLVVDAMTGQDAVNVAERFAEAVQFDGVVMSKLDGDARGGAALSVKAVTGKPILFASTGEKLDQFERFHPDRMAQRILGMGDVMSLIEKAEQELDVEQAAELERRLRRNEFDLEDFLGQLKAIRRMGPLSSLLGMIPGLGAGQLRGLKLDERELDRIEAIILSMTPEERRRPELIKGSRRLRIARGSGTRVQQVNNLVKQFGQMRKVMRQVGRGRTPDVGALLRQGR